MSSSFRWPRWRGAAARLSPAVSSAVSVPLSVAVSAAVPLALSLALSILSWSALPDPRVAAGTQTPPARGAEPAAASEADVRTRCGTACHKLPPPDILPKSAWRDELVRMMLIQDNMPEMDGGGALMPLPPDWLRLLRYYEAHAPERLPPPEPWPSAAESKAASTNGAPLGFTTHAIARLLDQKPSAVANVRFADVDEDGRLDVVASDMRNGQVVVADAKAEFGVKTLATLQNPAHIEPIDLDKDGRQDLLVADLGSFQPADHQNGAVVLLKRRADGGFTTFLLAQGLPRLADARAADFDGDGDLDVIAAAFGWRRTGSILLLRNDTKDWRAPRFVSTVVDPRTGAIHVPIADLNKDGRPDFVALLAQEHESIVAFLNTGASPNTSATAKTASKTTGPTTTSAAAKPTPGSAPGAAANGAARSTGFKAETIYAAPHPNWGSSGIDLADLDKDGDLDVLFAHGDTFDDFVLKPYHGLLWLENRGTFPFTPHPLATLPGAQAVKAVDLDADGDLDIVASAMVAGSGDMEPTLASVVWLEQVRPGIFERRTLEMGTPFHASIDAADYDGDGDVDLVVGWFALGKPVRGWIDLWERVTASPRAASRPVAAPAAPPATAPPAAADPAAAPAPRH